MVPVALGDILGDGDFFVESMILRYGLVIAAILVAGGLMVAWIRSRYHPSARRRDGTQSGGFEMEHIRDLHRSGEISDEEYRRLRRLALGLGPEKAETGESKSSGPPPGVDDVNIAPTDGSCAEGGGPQKESE